MKKNIIKISLLVLILLVNNHRISAQICEWRLSNALFNATDPDGAGLATGSVSFKFQVHTTSGSIVDVTGLSCGWSFQSADAMIPTIGGPGCTINVNNPGNVTIAPGIFATAGYVYSTVSQCNTTFPQTINGKMYDRTSAGTLEGGSITLTTTWVDAYIVTLWTKGTVNPQGGFAVINSSATGTPNPLGSYGLSDLGFNDYQVNSLTASTPLPLGSAPTPVTFAKFEASCNDKGTSLEWITSQEVNSKNYEVEKSYDGVNWKPLATIKAAGNSSTDKVYIYLDLIAGAANYRIKQIDIDGRFTYTDVKSTSCVSKNINVVVYPVPAQNKLNVAISSNKNVNTQFIIYDATGRMVKQLTERIITGNNNIQIDLTNLPSGQYILRSTDEVLNINKKFTVLK